jgi:hypothetical protein
VLELYDGRPTEVNSGLEIDPRYKAKSAFSFVTNDLVVCNSSGALNMLIN